MIKELFPRDLTSRELISLLPKIELVVKKEWRVLKSNVD